MTSKLHQKKNHKKKPQIMFQICVPEQKVQGKIQRYVFETFYKCNEIKNIKIHNFLILLKFQNL